MSEVGAARVADYERTRRAEGAARHTIQKELSVLKQTVELALKGGPAALGIDEVIDATRERRLLRLFLDGGFAANGWRS